MALKSLDWGAWPVSSKVSPPSSAAAAAATPSHIHRPGWNSELSASGTNSAGTSRNGCTRNISPNTRADPAPAPIRS